MEVRETSHHEGYFVSEEGRVYSQKFNSRRELKQSEHKGYRRVALSSGNKRTQYPVHRLVAEAFIPNPEDKPFVNHKDGNRRNNNCSNLEWCTAKENQAHSREVLGNTHRGERNPNWGNRMSRFYPSQELRNRLIELGVPRYKHDIVSLGEMLPHDFVSGHTIFGYDCWSESNVIKAVVKCAEATEADARAKMLIYLLENKLITV